MKNKACIIFDFGGVIADSFGALYKISRSLHLAESEQEAKALFKGNFVKRLKDKLTPGQIKNFFSAYRPADNALVPGMDKVIRAAAENYVLAIVSSTTASSITRFLTLHNLKNYFTEIMGYEISPSKTEKINELMATYSIEPQKCLMITDTIGDIKEARDAGVPSIGVTWGYHDRDTLEGADPTAIVNSPEELLLKINSFFS